MKLSAALGGGLAGACALTLIHESVKRVVPEAPRMDLLGMDALRKGLATWGADIPDDRKLFTLTLAGDVLSNALYYSLAGLGGEKGVWLRGGLLGAAAGLGAVLLPGPMGLRQGPSNRTTETKLMTVGLYLAGGLIAAAAISFLYRRNKKRTVREEAQEASPLMLPTAALG